MYKNFVNFNLSEKIFFFLVKCRKISWHLRGRTINERPLISRIGAEPESDTTNKEHYITQTNTQTTLNTTEFHKDLASGKEREREREHHQPSLNSWFWAHRVRILLYGPKPMATITTPPKITTTTAAASATIIHRVRTRFATTHLPSHRAAAAATPSALSNASPLASVTRRFTHRRFSPSSFRAAAAASSSEEQSSSSSGRSMNLHRWNYHVYRRLILYFYLVANVFGVYCTEF